jgi:hypothetical protein
MHLLSFPDTNQAYFVSDDLLTQMRKAAPNRIFDSTPVPYETALAMDLANKFRGESKRTVTRDEGTLTDMEKLRAQRMAKVFTRK